MAVDAGKEAQVADVYAAALFAIASDTRRTDEVRSELAELVRLIEQNPALAGFFSSNAVAEDDRELSLERMFRGRLSDAVLNTLHVMNQHGRLALIPQLEHAYVHRLEEAHGQVKVTATTAVELDQAQQAEVAGVAERLSGKKPLVQYTVAPEIIGGLILQMGDYRYDNSLRRQLHTARARLLERPARSGPSVEGG